MSFYKTISNPERVRANQELRRSAASGFHKNKKCGKGGRSMVKKKIIDESR